MKKDVEEIDLEKGAGVRGAESVKESSIGKNGTVSGSSRGGRSESNGSQG